MDKITLSQTDAALVADLMENPPEANEAMKKALKNYQDKIQSGEIRDDAEEE